LESRFGDFKQRVEVCDIATPATYIRYTSNWKASNGFSASKKTFLQSIPKELNGLNNFYMAGLWTEIGGGVPMCMISGRNVAQLICKKDKIKFRTSVN
jgi:phytoene dehydrogenase-like protein